MDRMDMDLKMTMMKSSAARSVKASGVNGYQMRMEKMGHATWKQRPGASVDGWKIQTKAMNTAMTALNGEVNGQKQTIMD